MNYLLLLPLALFFGFHSYGYWRRRQEFTARLRVLGAIKKMPTKTGRIALLTKPLAGASERQRLGSRLRAAGFNSPAAMEIFLLAKLTIFVVALLAGWWFLDLQISTMLKQPLALGKLLLLLYAAVRLPDWIISERHRARQRRMRSSVPQMLDLLTVCADAGLSLEDSLNRIADEIKTYSPDISAELQQTASELLVMPDRTEAIQRLGTRSDVEELKHLADVLVQSLQFGTPLAQAMRTIAADCRMREIAGLEERAGKLAAAIGVPLIVLVLLPLVVLMTAPAAISLVRTLNKVGT